MYPITKVSADNTKTELNCRNTKPILLYFEEKYGREKLKDFIRGTEMNLDYLENPNNWVSYSYYCGLLAKLVEYTSDPRAPFTAGLYTTRNECYGALANIVKRFGTPASTYKLIAEMTSRYSKLGMFNISNIRKNSCTITTTYYEQFKQDKNNCLNVQGIFSSIPTFWNLPLAKVKELKCAALGDEVCEYEIFWHNRVSRLFGIVGSIIGIVLAFILNILMPQINVFILSVVPLLGYFAGRARDYKITLKDYAEINEAENKNLMESIETIEELNTELQNKVEQRTHELSESNKELQNVLDELKKSQYQLVHSEKMASIGQLAAGVAHEINNPIAIIKGNVQYMLKKLNSILAGGSHEKNSVLECIETSERIVEETERCGNIVLGLLEFSSEKGGKAWPLDINEEISTTVALIEHSFLLNKIRLEQKLSPNLPYVVGGGDHLRQVFMNIAINARDAMPDGGVFTIETTYNSESKKVEVKLVDTGVGIPAPYMNRIFDPFFTTKKTGKGSGLGLSISHGIIKIHKGSLNVKSEVGQGTTFLVSLPAAEDSQVKGMLTQ
ncbi:MAG: hypothetical protein KJ864_05025 [Candidatus Omnitrophica bacterium]|nr:hypothetical protein [Candidatus Omnitrophota bacterium]MBU1894766.1 hypothetical protein [Candidatus Omnitrophota bacterium]